MRARHHRERCRGSRKSEVRSTIRSNFELRTSYFSRLSWALALCALHPALSEAQPRPTFTKDIAPIVWSRCASCHRPGEIGPFSLITYEDVRRHATQIADVTARRVMPPWKPIAGKGDFQSERRLTDSELQLLQRWISSGAPRGDIAALPPPPDWIDGWQLGRPDLVVRMPEEYLVAADG